MAYEKSVEALVNFFRAMREDGLEDVVSKGGIGEILLADKLGHTLVDGDKGADGKDDDGKLYEYKVSITNQYNFRFGTRPNQPMVKGESDPDLEKMITKHFLGFEGAICAERKRGTAEISRAVFVSKRVIVDYLKKWFQSKSPNQVIKNFTLDDFAKLESAKELI
jgi:hypothetical protein|tara:strand:- start:108 stop:602 length:495 start_codon:yes stop_codon:yes gene_type:complete